MDLRQLRAQAHAGHIDSLVKTGNVLGQRAEYLVICNHVVKQLIIFAA
jgi:hypothetical protein